MSSTVCSVEQPTPITSQSLRGKTLVSESQSHSNPLKNLTGSSNISPPNKELKNELAENVKEVKNVDSTKPKSENSSHQKSKTNPPFLHHSSSKEVSKDIARRSSMEWMTQMCHFVVRDLEKYGICVVDNFMGKERAEALHSSVVSMYDSGILKNHAIVFFNIFLYSCYNTFVFFLVKVSLLMGKQLVQQWNQHGI